MFTRLGKVRAAPASLRQKMVRTANAERVNRCQDSRIAANRPPWPDSGVRYGCSCGWRSVPVEIQSVGAPAWLICVPGAGHVTICLRRSGRAGGEKATADCEQKGEDAYMEKEVVRLTALSRVLGSCIDVTLSVTEVDARLCGHGCPAEVRGGPERAPVGTIATQESRDQLYVLRLPVLQAGNWGTYV